MTIDAMEPLQPTTTRLVRAAKVVIEIEEDTHRAAIEDNPDKVRVSSSTWAAIFFLSLSFGPPIGLGFLSVAAIIVQITSDLDGLDKLTWVVGAWSLSTAVSFSLAGPLSDVFGRRLPVLIGQAVTTLGLLLGGVAPNVATLIVGETFIGLGTGLLFVSYAGVPEMLPNKWRALGLGILEAGIALPWGVVAGILGNVLNEYATWRWLFYIGIILEVIGFAGTAFFYWPTARPRGDFDRSRWDEIREVDFIGLFLFTCGLTTFLIGLTWGGSSAHPWKSAGCIAPISVGFLTLCGCFAYEFTVAKDPLFPRQLFAQWRQFTLLLVVLFISGMNFYSMSALLPQGSLYMFTTDGLQIGVISLPNTVMQLICGVALPMVAHKIGYVKWQLLVALSLQLIFIAATAGAVYPNHKLAWMFLPAFGVPMFAWVTLLSYSIAGLHVPHSRLGVATGLLGTFRSAGGAVGNAIFGTIFNDRFTSYVGPAVAETALSHGLKASAFPEIIPAAIETNIGIPGLLDAIPGMTPVIQDALRVAVRGAYGHAFRIVFYVTIPFGIIALVCALFVEDPTKYMTNHIQFEMNKDDFVKRAAAVNALDSTDTEKGPLGSNNTEKACHLEEAPTVVEVDATTLKQ